MTETLGLTGGALRRAARRARALAAASSSRAYLDRIDAADEAVHAFLRTRREAALAEADRFDRDGRSGLQGVPIALKDILCTKGEETTAGSRILEGYVPIYDGGCVTRVKAAGLVSLGKTNMDEFAMGSSTENSAFGVTHNPWDADRVPGGSSGGSAAAVAAGFAPLALGTDTGGSIRQPAALCGVVGMKPTYGAVSRYGLIAFASSLDQIGPFALTVRDCALLMQVICGQDALRLDLGRPARADRGADGREPRRRPPRRARPTCSPRASSPACAQAFDASLRAAEGLGARVVETTLPHAGYALPAYYLIAPAEASANLSRFDGVRFGLRLRGAGRHRRRHVRAHPRGRVRRRGEAPDHARHLRPLGRLLRRLLRHGAEGAHAHPRGLRRCLRRGRPDRDADVARPSRSGSASASTTPGRCTRPTCSPCP